MSISKQQIVDTIFRAIDELNMLLPSHMQLTKQSSTILLGEGGVLDSLGLINLIVSVEDKMQSELGVQVIILDEDSLANPKGPYQTIDGLASWILSRIG